METPHQQVLVRPSPAAASALLDDRRVGSAMGTPTPAEAAAAAAAGNILCAGCGSIAGDYLQEPDLSACCFRCLRRLPLCRRCVDAASPGGDPDERRALDEVVCCSLCIRVVCRAPGCSTRCSDRACEALVCSKCRPSLPECSGCLMPHCEGTGDSPGTGCLSKCRGKPDCAEGICRLCERGRCGCEMCGAASCDSCRRECNVCGTVSCPECHVLAQVPRFCEGCGADRCMVCAVRMRACEECGQRVTRERLLEGMSSMTGFIEKWSTFDLPGNTNTTTTTTATTSRKAQDQSGATTPELLRRRSLTNRAEIAQRWMTFVSSAYTNGEPALPRAGPGYPVAGAGVGAGAAASAASAVPSVAELTTSEGGPGGACVADRTVVAAAAAAASSARDSRPPVLRALAAGAPPPRGTPAPVLPSPSVKAAAKNAGQAVAAAEAAFEEKASAGLAGRGGGGGGAGVSGGVAAAASAAATPETRGGKTTAGQQQQQEQQQQSAAHPSGRLSIDMLREFVATSNETNRFPTGVAEIKAVFHGWVEPAVVDLYYDGSRNIPRTLNQCQKDVEQVAINDHAAAAAATRATASPAPSSAPPPTSDGARDWVGYTSTEPGSIGRTYWHNTRDGRTTWEDPYAGDVLRPLLGQQAQVQQQQGAASAVAVATHGGRKGEGAPMTVDEAAAEGRLYISAWKSGGFDIDQYDAWMTRAMAAVKNQADHGGGGAEGAASKELLRLVVTDAGVWCRRWGSSSVLFFALPEGDELRAGEAWLPSGILYQYEVGRKKKRRMRAEGDRSCFLATTAVPSIRMLFLLLVDGSLWAKMFGEHVRVRSVISSPFLGAVEASALPTTLSRKFSSFVVVLESCLARRYLSRHKRDGQGRTRSASGKKEAAGASSLEAQMADLQAAEERKQTAKAKKAARYCTVRQTERESRPRTLPNPTIASMRWGYQRDSTGGSLELFPIAFQSWLNIRRIAEAKAATEARVMATVAAAARAEREAKEAARRKQKEDADAQEAERARRQERARACPPCLAGKTPAHPTRPPACRAVRRQDRPPEAALCDRWQASVRDTQRRVTAAKRLRSHNNSEDETSLMSSPSFPSNALAVQSIYDEADQTPGANMKKIKKKCQRWLNKKAGEVGSFAERLLALSSF
ncbi:unnamed protein product [Scytosiphon promiscuus]